MPTVAAALILTRFHQRVATAYEEALVELRALALSDQQLLDLSASLDELLPEAGSRPVGTTARAVGRASPAA